MAHDVFISYATKDKPIADAVCAAIEARGFRCWIAPRDVLTGMPYGEAIVDAIQGSRVMVVVFSSNANASTHIPKEVERAATRGVTIMPLRVEDVLPAKSLDYFLASLHWLDALTAPLEPHLQKLTEAIAQTLPNGVAPGTTRVVASPPVSKLPLHTERQPWWRSRGAITIAAIVLLVTVAGAAWSYRSRMTGSETIGSLAVLPFVNGSGDSNMEYLSDGITESLINSLSQLPHLKVMSRDSAFMYKGKDADAHTVGQALGVRAVLKGRVMQRGDDLEISAELVDARDDSHIWGQQYSRKAADIFALQNDLAKEMTSMLRMRLTGDDEKQMTKSYTANPEAYQDYLKGLYWLNKGSRQGTSKAIESFQQAIEKDPSYALAYAGLADGYSMLVGLALDPPKDAYPKAKEAALKALELDDTLAETHSSLALIKSQFEWDWSGAEKEYQRAITLNPKSATIHSRYSGTLVHMGRLEQAIAEAKRALELDPLSLPINRGLGDTYYFARQYDQAIEQENKTLELDPNFELAYNDVALAYSLKSMYSEAIAESKKQVALDPRAAPLGVLAYAYGKGGKKAEAQKVLDTLLDMSKHQYVQPRVLARVYVGLGDKEKAFEYLEKSYQDRSIGTAFGLINTDPSFDPLRSDPRFADLLRRMNLQT